MDGWSRSPARGHRRGSFDVHEPALPRLVPRQTTEPHNLPLQFLTEPGIVGLVLFLLASPLAAAPRSAAGAATSSRSRCSCPPTSCTGSSTSTGTSSPSPRRRSSSRARSPGGAPTAARLAVRARSPRRASRCSRSACCSLPWLGERWSGEALARRRRPRARSRSRSARTRSTRCSSSRSGRRRSPPRRADEPTRARSPYYVQAVASQPKNPQTWLLGRRVRALTAAAAAARTRTSSATRSSIRKARPSAGADDYREALRSVELGKRPAELARAEQTASWPPCSADGFRPSSGPTTFTCRSCARRSASAAEARRYMTTVVA